MAAPKRCTTRATAEKLLEDAEGLVQLSNMQLRLAVELRRKAELLAKPEKKPASKKKPKKRRQD